jgi:hypothetical protein
MNTPTPEQIDTLAMRLGTIGVRVPGRDTAFFHAIVRQWLEEIGKEGPAVSASRDQEKT